MTSEELKREAHALIDRLPEEGLTWQRLAYHFGVRATLEQRLEHGEANAIDTATLRQRLGLEKPEERKPFAIVPFNSRINPEFEGNWERMRDEIYSDRR